MSHLWNMSKDVLEIVTNKLSTLDFMNFYGIDPARFNKYQDFWYRRGKRDFPYAVIKDYKDYLKFFTAVKFTTNNITNYLVAQARDVLRFLERDVIKKAYTEEVFRHTFNLLGKINPQNTKIHYGSDEEESEIDMYGLIVEYEPALIKYFPFAESGKNDLVYASDDIMRSVEVHSMNFFKFSYNKLGK